MTHSPVGHMEQIGVFGGELSSIESDGQWRFTSVYVLNFYNKKVKNSNSKQTVEVFLCVCGGVNLLVFLFLCTHTGLTTGTCPSQHLHSRQRFSASHCPGGTSGHLLPTKPPRPSR